MKNPYMPFWVNDYRNSRAVRLMDFESKGMYIDMICELWADEWLPSNEADLIKILATDKRTFKRIWPKIKPRFIILQDKITHKRVKEELNKFYAKSKQNSDNALKGWEKRRESDAVADASASIPQRNPEPEPNPETESYKSPDSYNPPYEHINSPGPKKFDDKTGFRISQIINANAAAFDEDSTDTSNNVKKLFTELLTVRELKAQHLKTLGYIIQTRGIVNVKDPVAFCIKLIKAPKFSVADICLQKAKETLDVWYPINKKVQEITPDLRPSD